MNLATYLIHQINSKLKNKKVVVKVLELEQSNQNAKEMLLKIEKAIGK